MCNTKNLISSVQTSGIRIRITGYSFRKALETEKNMLESFLHLRKRQHIFFCVNHQFQAIWSRKFFCTYIYCSESSETWKKTKKKNPFSPRIRIRKKMRIRNTVTNVNRSRKEYLDIIRVRLLNAWYRKSYGQYGIAKVKSKKYWRMWIERNLLFLFLINATIYQVIINA